MVPHLYNTQEAETGGLLQGLSPDKSTQKAMGRLRLHNKTIILKHTYKNANKNPKLKTDKRSY